VPRMAVANTPDHTTEDGRPAAHPSRGPRLVIVDDDALARHAVRRLLEGAGPQVVVQARTRSGAIDVAREHDPDLALVDLPIRESIDIVRQLTATQPRTRAITMTIGDDPDGALAAIRAGARGALNQTAILTVNWASLLDAAVDDELMCRRSTMTALVDQRSSRRRSSTPATAPSMTR
jgi:DNA-binding NarL/FixJ family response regulator